MAQRRPTPPDPTPLAPVSRRGEPKYAIPFDDEGNDIRYFWTDEEADAAVTDEMIQRALDAAGAWSDLDLDWEEVEAELHRIRHANPPSPPFRLDE